MLKQLRKKGTAKKILWGITLVIIPSFGFFWNANQVDRQQITHAGKIFGRKVSFDDFQKSLLHTRNQNLLRHGDNFNKISQFLNLESEAWDRLILLNEAKKRRIRILDQEVVDMVEDFDFFKNNGVFDPVIYDKIVRYVFRCEPRDFEEGIRETLTFAKLYEQETSDVTLADEDILNEYKKQNEMVQVSYVFLPTADYVKDVNPDPKAAEDYFNEHKDDFTLPLTVNIQYLALPIPEAAKDEEKSALKTQAENIVRDLQTDPGMEAVAKKYGLEMKESGLFSQEEPVLNLGLPFEALRKAFELQVGEISSLLETPKGFYILKLKEKKESHLPEFAEVSKKVTDTLINLKAKDIAKQKAGESLAQIKEIYMKDPQAHFMDTVKALGLKPEQTPMFKRGDYLPTIGMSSDFQEGAFALNGENTISPVVEIKKGYCILHFDKLQPIDQDKFAKEKDEFSKNLLNDKKNEIFSEFVGALRLKANLEDNIAKLKKENQTY